MCRHFAEELGIVVAAVEYRLAPGTRTRRHCTTATTHWPGWSVSSTWTRAASPSAGGAQVPDWPRPWLCSPMNGETYHWPSNCCRIRCWTTARRTAPGSTSRSSGCGTTRPTASAGKPTRAAAGSVDVASLAAPARYGDLRAFRRRGSGWERLDPFDEEDLAYVGRLGEAGVKCELDIVTGAFHGFDSIRPKTGVSREFRSAQAAALRAALC